MDGCDSISTLMATTKLDANLHGTPTDQYVIAVHESEASCISPLVDPKLCLFPHLCIAPLIKHDLQSEHHKRDADHEGAMEDCKSTSEATIFREKNSEQSSKKQVCKMMSMVEAK
ncbi:hypothetical protein Tco_1175739 [Tanacetum coccineum]